MLRIGSGVEKTRTAMPLAMHIVYTYSNPQSNLTIAVEGEWMWCVGEFDSNGDFGRVTQEYIYIYIMMHKNTHAKHEHFIALYWYI